MKLIQKTFNGDYIVFEDKDLNYNGGCFSMLLTYVIGFFVVNGLLFGGIWVLGKIFEFLFWIFGIQMS